MKKVIILLISYLLLQGLVFGQSEYKYFGLRLGLIHGYSFMQGESDSKFLNTPNSELKLMSKTGFNYMPGFNFDLYYHLDAKNDKYGLVIGLEFNTMGIQNRYQTVDKIPIRVYDQETGEFVLSNMSLSEEYTLKERFRTYSVGVPVFLKFGNSNIYKNQQYLFAGLQLNYNINVINSSTISWSSETSRRPLETAEYNKTSLMVILGFNYGVFNLELNYLPKTFVNVDFLNAQNQKPYEAIKGNQLFLKTSFNIPLTRWLTIKSWTAEKIRRTISFNRGG